MSILREFLQNTIKIFRVSQKARNATHIEQSFATQDVNFQPFLHIWLDACLIGYTIIAQFATRLFPWVEDLKELLDIAIDNSIDELEENETNACSQLEYLQK